MIKELTEVGEVTEVIRQIEHFFMQGSTLLSKIITTYIHRITIVVLHQAEGQPQERSKWNSSLNPKLVITTP